MINADQIYNTKYEDWGLYPKKKEVCPKCDSSMKKMEYTFSKTSNEPNLQVYKCFNCGHREERRDYDSR